MMKVLLLQNVQKVGKKDEVVDVSDGFAAHALLPKKLAVPATKAAVEARDRRLKNAHAEQEVRHALLRKTIATLQDTPVVLKVKANPQGNLFSKIRAQDLSEFLMQTYHISLEAEVLQLPEIKKLGQYEIGVKDDTYTGSFTITLTH